jgi:hypothetical protein
VNEREELAFDLHGTLVDPVAIAHKLAVLPNGTPAMIANCLGNGGLGEFFGPVISGLPGPDDAVRRRPGLPGPARGSQMLNCLTCTRRRPACTKRRAAAGTLTCWPTWRGPSTISRAGG